MKTIYKPKGRAGEYAQWACNMYVGCSNNCSYCYCKKGVLSHAMGASRPTLKKGVGENEKEAFKNFTHDIERYQAEIRRDGGLFFTFTSDPLLPETKKLNLECIKHCLKNNVAVKVLTKCTAWADEKTIEDLIPYQDILIIGFTLTGHDEMEPGAASNEDRLKLMEKLYKMGFHIWASIEPVVTRLASLKMVQHSNGFCEHYKIGLMSGKRPYKPSDMPEFMSLMEKAAGLSTIYWKQSVIDYLEKSNKK